MKKSNHYREFEPVRKIGFIILMLTCCRNVSASPVAEFGEQSAIFVASCLSVDYLKKRHCPSISTIDYKSCISRAEDLLPQRMRVEFRQAMATNDRELHSTISEGIDRGYSKSVDLLNGDKNSACSNYATSLNTVVYMKYEEMKRIAQRIK